MPEIAWVAGILLLLVAVGAVELVPWGQLIESGNALMLNSAALGIPLELVYFAALFAALSYGGRLPAGWYWRSFQHHHLLTRPQRYLVLPFFFSGALSFLCIVLGIVVTVLGMVGAIVQNR